MERIELEIISINNSLRCLDAKKKTRIGVGKEVKRNFIPNSGRNGDGSHSVSEAKSRL